MSQVNIDLSYLNTVAGGDNEFVKEMLTMFLNSAPTELGHIENAFLNGDIKTMGQAAHKFKAPIQMLGEPELADIIIKIEHIGKFNEGVSELPGLLAQFKTRLEQVKSEASRLIAIL